MTISNFQPTIWASELLVRFAASEVLAATCNRQYEGEATSGNKVNITGITTPTIVDYKAAGRVLDPEDLSDTTQQLPIDQEKAYGFNVDDVDRTQAAGSFEPVTRDSADALVEDAEGYIGGVMVSGGTLVGLGTDVVTDGNAAFDKINAIRTAMGKAKVPMSQRYLAVNPDFSGLLLGADSKLTSANISGDAQGLRQAVLGAILGFTVVETPMLGVAGKPTVVGYHKSAVAYVNQINKPEALRNQNKFADIIRGLHVYGAKVIRPTAVQYWAAA